jgi:hypothetical protein
MARISEQVKGAAGTILGTAEFSLDASRILSFLAGEVAEWLKAAVC